MNKILEIVNKLPVESSYIGTDFSITRYCWQKDAYEKLVNDAGKQVDIAEEVKSRTANDLNGFLDFVTYSTLRSYRGMDRQWFACDERTAVELRIVLHQNFDTGNGRKAIGRNLYISLFPAVAIYPDEGRSEMLCLNYSLTNQDWQLGTEGISWLNTKELYLTPDQIRDNTAEMLDNGTLSPY